MLGEIDIGYPYGSSGVRRNFDSPAGCQYAISFRVILLLVVFLSFPTF